jgi:hypothetical protein
MLLAGTLHIKSNPAEAIRSGLLRCELGDFIVQDERLNPLDEGEHVGFFDIARIEPSANLSDGRLFFEIKASINAMAFPLTAASPTENAVKPKTVVAKASPTKEITAPAEPGDLLIEEESEDAALFVASWPLGDTVQLDATCARDVLSAQRARLIKLGFKFNSAKQLWQKTAT